MKKLTIKDISSLAGVSRGTIDRVINNRGNVSPAIEERVLKILKEFGYEKNLIASTLAANKSYRIAIVLPYPEDDIFWALPRKGIEKALAFVKNFGFQCENYDFELENKNDFSIKLNNAIQSKPDGIIVAPLFLEESAEYLEDASSYLIPVITINTELENKNLLCYIGQNSYQCGYLAGRLLKNNVRSGETIIAIHLGHDLKDAKHILDKIKGLQDYVAQEMGNNANVQIYNFENFRDKEALSEFYESIIKNHPKITALFFTNSRAYHLMEIIEKNKILDKTIIGFDLLPPNNNLLNDGKISFLIHQDPERQGYMAIENFVRYFLKKPVQPIQYLPMDIILKENIAFYLQNSGQDMDFIL
ncbi:MAG: LacI family DNA-binding transcriptional regulator [Saprospiraceae bacterium]|nr:LacI family DNA-binding transcriptional regulator [Saprospiraceae bacterium]